jgi:hypothetical protein
MQATRVLGATTKVNLLAKLSDCAVLAAQQTQQKGGRCERHPSRCSPDTVLILASAVAQSARAPRGPSGTGFHVGPGIGTPSLGSETIVVPTEEPRALEAAPSEAVSGGAGGGPPEGHRAHPHYQHWEWKETCSPGYWLYYWDNGRPLGPRHQVGATSKHRRLRGIGFGKQEGARNIANAINCTHARGQRRSLLGQFIFSTGA